MTRQKNYESNLEKFVAAGNRQGRPKGSKNIVTSETEEKKKKSDYIRFRDSGLIDPAPPEPDRSKFYKVHFPFLKTPPQHIAVGETMQVSFINTALPTAHEQQPVVLSDEDKKVLDTMAEMIVDNLFTANNLHL